jgi:AcrR family transcriptional regulator
MSKIAKKANVSSSTIYVYFENMEDMLNKLYLTFKKKMSQRIFKGFDETIPLKTGFETALRNFADFILTNKEYFLFAEQFSNSPLIHKLSHEEGNVLFEPIYSNLYEHSILGVVHLDCLRPIDRVMGLITSDLFRSTII